MTHVHPRASVILDNLEDVGDYQFKEPKRRDHVDV
jgi:hypothetical protein